MANRKDGLRLTLLADYYREEMEWRNNNYVGRLIKGAEKRRQERAERAEFNYFL